MPIVLVSLGYVVFVAAISVLRARQQRVRCPETGRLAEVRCDPRAAVRGTFGDGQDEVAARVGQNAKDASNAA
jgi:hypothetical protein